MQYAFQPSEMVDSDTESHDGFERDPLTYPTHHRGTIRNAATGWPYDFKMGSLQQNTLFHVRHCANEFDERGHAPARVPVQKDPASLFYDSPKQYLVHRARLLGLPGTEDDVFHLLRRGYGSQPPLDLASWARMVDSWKAKKRAAIDALPERAF